jgi:predicted DNA binding CopG/RHH family protein
MKTKDRNGNPTPPIPKSGWEEAKRGAARQEDFLNFLKQHTHALTMLTVRVPHDLLERSKIRAIKEKSTLQKITAAALEAYLKTAIAPKGKGR